MKPSAIIPIHTNNPKAFADVFCEKWPVILLNDSESFSAIVDPWYDTTMAKVFAYKQPEDNYKEIENPENLPWFSFDERSLGEFQRWKDADDALHHVVYAPNRILAYSIESDDDMAPSLYVVYNPDFSEYSEGSHEPEGGNYQESSQFTPGERVWAIIDNELLVPCTFVGPVSEEYYRELQRKLGAANERVIDERISELWDWDWDKVIVRPLVKIKSEYGEIAAETEVQRIYVFPYDYIKATRI